MSPGSYVPNPPLVCTSRSLTGVFDDVEKNLLPEHWPSVFFLSGDMLVWGGVGCVITSFVFVITELLRWRHFMLRYTRLLHFDGHT